MRRGLRAGLWLLAAAQTALASPAVIENDNLRIELDLASGLPVGWSACAQRCGDPGAMRAELLGGEDGNRLGWDVPGDPGAARRLQSLGYALTAHTADELTLESLEPVNGRHLQHRYRLDAAGHRLIADIDLPDGAALAIVAGAAFVPEALPGFGAMYGRVRAVTVSDAGQVTLEPEPAERLDINSAAGEWSGIRNRFWALLLSTDAGSGLQAEQTADGLPRIVRAPATGAGRSEILFYGGPVEWQRLRAVDPVLSELLFAALWDWLRALCFGLLWLLTRLMQLIGNAGWSIVLLSVCVKLLMLPLTRIADRWQDDVNRTASLLKPELDAIKRDYRGEEAHRRTLAVYAKHGVHTMYTLKSLAGFLIQIPVFIAAFDMLGENFALNQAAFLWVDDLAKPDRWLPLPFGLPFFGASLNLLPFLMTGFTLWASMLQTEASLTPDLMRQQRLRLYAMAAVFFLLFYTFPAGMVLYWTTNNVLHLVKVLYGRLRGRENDS